jgi:Domain of unknown function (DUF4410)
MKSFSFLPIIILTPIIVLTTSLGVVAPNACAARAAQPVPQTPSGDPFPNKAVTIYVADFDLQATHAPGSSGSSLNRVEASSGGAPLSGGASTGTSTGTSGAAVSAAAPGGPAPVPPASATADGQRTGGQKSEATRAEGDAAKVDGQTDDSPRAQAAKLVELTATTLVKILEQYGYTARRLRGSASRPDSGVILQGVFAQVDPNFGIRRVVIGGLATDPQMLLFVGVGNLAKPAQDLYAVISPQPADNLGPLISVSVYAPIGRYELDREPSEELLKRAATQIASDVTQLLNANPLALQD